MNPNKAAASIEWRAMLLARPFPGGFGHAGEARLAGQAGGAEFTGNRDRHRTLRRLCHEVDLELIALEGTLERHAVAGGCGDGAGDHVAFLLELGGGRDVAEPFDREHDGPFAGDAAAVR